MQRPDQSRALWAAGRYGNRLSHDLRHGAVAGCLGGLSIMIFFLAYDALSFRPLATPDFLADVVLGEEVLSLDMTVQLRAARIIIFTVLHMAVFAVLGMLLSNLFRIAGTRESPLPGGLYGLTVCTVLFGVVLHLSGTELLAEPQWPSVLLGNFVAGVVMAGYLRFQTSLLG